MKKNLESGEIGEAALLDLLLFAFLSQSFLLGLGELLGLLLAALLLLLKFLCLQLSLLLLSLGELTSFLFLLFLLDALLELVPVRTSLVGRLGVSFGHVLV